MEDSSMDVNFIPESPELSKSNCADMYQCIASEIALDTTTPTPVKQGEYMVCTSCDYNPDLDAKYPYTYKDSMTGLYVRSIKHLDFQDIQNIISNNGPMSYHASNRVTYTWP